LGKVTTNTVEGFHGVIKRQARNTNLFAGRSSKDAFLHDKLEELEFRFNIREKGDMFFVFLHALLHVYSPKPCVDIVENQHGCSKVVVRAMKQPLIGPIMGNIISLF
jgi:hypothetical protein